MLQPRELMREHGAQPLSDAELLRVLLRNGNATVPVGRTVAALQTAYPKLVDLATAGVPALLQLPGIGLSKATVLSAAVELGRRVQVRQTLRHGQIISSEQVGQQMMERLAGLGQEILLAILLDVKNRVIQELEVGRGALDRSLADPRIVFRAALLASAAKLILVHNHPSGDVTPSAADTDMTVRFVEAGALIGVAVIDHVIVGGSSYYSFHANDRL